MLKVIMGLTLLCQACSLKETFFSKTLIFVHDKERKQAIGINTFFKTLILMLPHNNPVLRSGKVKRSASSS